MMRMEMIYGVNFSDENDVTFQQRIFSKEDLSDETVYELNHYIKEEEKSL